MMHQFKVGDAVRVKAGISSKTHFDTSPGFVGTMDKLRGTKMVVASTASFDRVYVDQWEWLSEWLEPWNDSEEWDGEKWVAKSKFKVGDRVKIIGPSNIGTILDEEYPHLCGLGVIDGFLPGTGNCLVKSLNGWNSIYYPPSSLVIADIEPPQPKPAIVILREDGFLKPHIHPTVYESTSKAKEEAKRLAELHKGKEFVVFQEVDRKQVRETIAEKIARIDKEHREKAINRSYQAADGSTYSIKHTDVFAIDNTLIIKHSFND